MSFISIGDLSSSMRLRFLNADIKNSIGQLGSELSSGTASDLSKHLGGDLDRLGSINRSLKMVEAYRIWHSEMVSRGVGLQTSLENVQSAIEQTGASTISAANTVTAASLDSAANAALEKFQTVVSSLNSQTGGRSLFSGQAYKSPALVSVADMLDDLETLAVGATTANQVELIILDYFVSTGGGFETSAYLGSTTDPGPVRVSETESAGFSVSANSDEIRASLVGLAEAALLSRGVLSGDLLEQAELLKSAGQSMLSATDGLTTLRAEIGGVEERLTFVGTTLSAQKTALELTLGDMTSIDLYETATRLQNAETSLEALYIATSRLSQLSLSKYLR